MSEKQLKEKEGEVDKENLDKLKNLQQKPLSPDIKRSVDEKIKNINKPIRK